MCQKEKRLSTNGLLEKVIEGLEGALIRLDGIDNKLSTEEKRSVNIAYDVGLLLNQANSISDMAPVKKKPALLKRYVFHLDNEARWVELW